MPNPSPSSIVTGLRVCTALLLLAAPGRAAHAQAPPPRVTLADALARAAANSHRLAELTARESASGAVVDQHARADLPIVAAHAGYQRTNHVDEFGFIQSGQFQVLYPDVPDNSRARLDLQWPIYTGGRTQALERAARAEQHAAGRDLEAARADLRLETTRAFWALVTAAESVVVVEGAVKRMEAQLHDVRARFDAGFLPPNDVLTVEARVARQTTLLIEARNNRDSVRAELARLMGAPLDADFEADADLADTPAASAAGGPRPTAARAERDAQQLRVEAAEARVAAARADARPSVALLAGYDYARPNPRIFPRKDAWEDSWDIGVNVSFTLWNGGRTAAQVAQTRLLADAARARLAEVDSQIALEIRQRRLDLASSVSQVETALAAVRAATEARRVVAERFSAGVATSSDLLDAEVDQLQAELDRTRARAGVRLAQARLDRALGR
jgi:outer membrane protein TolC